MSDLFAKARRLNIALMRRAFGLTEGRQLNSVQVQSGRVKIFDGESDYWEIDEDGCLVISVELDDGDEKWCEAGPFGGGSTRGLYALPAAGDEAIVVFPEGDDKDAYLVQTFSTGNAPEDDLQAGRVLLMGGEVYIYDADGASVEPLVKKSEHEAHTHSIAGAVVIGAIPVVPAVAPTISPGERSSAPPTITGTTILKAK